MEEQFVITLEKNELISLKITCNTPVRIQLHLYLARGHQCIRKGTSLYTKFSLNSLFPVTLVSIDMELWLPSRMMTSTFCRFVWFVMYNGFTKITKDYQTLKPRLFSKSSLISSLYSCNNITTTLIQISRLFYSGFFPKTNHQMIIYLINSNSFYIKKQVV